MERITFVEVCTPEQKKRRRGKLHQKVKAILERNPGKTRRKKGTNRRSR